MQHAIPQTNISPTEKDNMKHLAAYLLLGLAGNNSPSAADITSVLESVGIEADSDRLTALLGELEGKDINELISEGSQKLASVPSGGAGGAAAASGGAAAGGAAAEDAAPEAAKEEEKEESDEDMGFGQCDFKLYPVVMRKARDQHTRQSSNNSVCLVYYSEETVVVCDLAAKSECSVFIAVETRVMMRQMA
nr:60s acidic ribosomal protein p2 [Quercus suber]